MTERERLIELLNEIRCFNSVYDATDYLLNNGVIVPLCKVGDKIYNIFEGNVLDYEIICIEKQCGEIYLYTCNAKYREKNGILYNENSRKTVFLTREEAEKALKACERSKEHGKT